MANAKISDLTQVQELGENSYFIIAKDGHNYSVTSYTLIQKTSYATGIEEVKEDVKELEITKQDNINEDNKLNYAYLYNEPKELTKSEIHDICKL